MKKLLIAAMIGLMQIGIANAQTKQCRRNSKAIGSGWIILKTETT
jgi:hypothetical protein